MKKFFFLVLIFGAAFYFSYDFIHTGKARNFILENHSQFWAPFSLYHLGNSYMLIQNYPRAEEIFEDYTEVFAREKRYQDALYKFYYIAAVQRRKSDTLERAGRYLEEFPDSERKRRVERRIEILDR